MCAVMWDCTVPVLFVQYVKRCDVCCSAVMDGWMARQEKLWLLLFKCADVILLINYADNKWNVTFNCVWSYITLTSIKWENVSNTTVTLALDQCHCQFQVSFFVCYLHWLLLIDGSKHYIMYIRIRRRDDTQRYSFKIIVTKQIIEWKGKRFVVLREEELFPFKWVWIPLDRPQKKLTSKVDSYFIEYPKMYL